jgi:two-component system chemotaxis response regulator CheY
MKTCLIVDDSSTIRRIVRNMLEDFGFLCAEAENGAKALDYCRGKRPDLVMLDWNMPVMTGIEFITALGREKKGDAFPPVIFCTTETDMSFIERAISAGAVDYIMKPFEKGVLQDKLVFLGLLEDAGGCV